MYIIYYIWLNGFNTNFNNNGNKGKIKYGIRHTIENNIYSDENQQTRSKNGAYFKALYII